MKAEIGDVWYRIVDGWSDESPPTVLSWPVEKVTPKGVRLCYGKFVLYPDEPRRVDGDGGRRYAYPTIELARGSYIIRKQRQKQHAANSHDKAKDILDRFEAGTLWDERAPTGIFNFTL